MLSSSVTAYVCVRVALNTAYALITAEYAFEALHVQRMFERNDYEAV